jgi:hypothetical protein
MSPLSAPQPCPFSKTPIGSCRQSSYPAAECPLLRPRLSGETVRVDEDWFVHQDGSLVPVAYSSAPVTWARGGRLVP